MSENEDIQETNSEEENEEGSHANSSDEDDTDQNSKKDDDNDSNSDTGELEEAGKNVIGQLLNGESDDDSKNNEDDKEENSDKEEDNEKEEEDNEKEEDSNKEEDNEKEEDSNKEEDNEKEEEDNEKEEDSNKEEDNEKEEDSNKEEDNEKEEDSDAEKANKSKKDNKDSGKLEEAGKSVIGQLLDGNDDDQNSDKEEDDTESTNENENNDEEFSEDGQVEVLVDRQEDDSSESPIKDNDDEESESGTRSHPTKKHKNGSQKSNDDDNKESESMMITEISNVVKPPNKQKTNTGRRVKTQQISLPTYTDDEIQEQINMMMKDKRLPEESYHQSIRSYVSRNQLKAAECGDYQKAEELESILDTLSELLNQDDSESREKIRQERVNEKIKLINEQHDKFLDDWNKLREKKLNEQEQNRIKMEKRHQEEIDNLQAECNDSGFVQRYNKPSPSLMNLRKTENQFAMAKLFDRAKYVKKQADSLQLIETKEAEKKMSDAVQIRYQAIEERQEREKECLEEHNRSILESLDRKKEKQQLAYEKAMSNLYSQLEPANKDKAETLKPQATKRPIRNTTKLTDTKSPATLDIPTIDVSKFKKQKRIIKPNQKNNVTKRKAPKND